MKKLLIGVLAVSFMACSKDTVTDHSSLLNGSTKNGGVEDNNPAVPDAVLSAFKASFGNVAVRQWKLGKDGTWRAHFSNNGVAWEASYTADGTSVKLEPE
jgi:hypothetical protein